MPNSQPSPWAFLNEDAMEQFLGDPQNAEASGAIMGTSNSSTKTLTLGDNCRLA